MSKSGTGALKDELDRIEEKRQEKIEGHIEAGFRQVARRNWEKAVTHGLLAHYYISVKGSGQWHVRSSLLPREKREIDGEMYHWWIGMHAGKVQTELQNNSRVFPDHYIDFMEFWQICDDYGYNFQAEIVDRMDLGYGGFRERLLKSLKLLEFVAEELELLEEPESTHRIGEDFEESPLYEFWQKRRRQGRIVTAIIVARDGETGVGKTTLGVALCKEFDDDWAADRATNRPWEYRGLVKSEPKGSVLLADEFATMFDARRSMSSGNVESSQDWQMLRKLEVSTVGTCPSMADVDRRFLRLMDLQFLVTRRGHARVYKMKINDDDGSLYREHLCNVEWPDLSDDEDYQAVETMKEERLSERLGGDDEHGDQEDGPSDELRREVRDEVIRQLVEEGVTQAHVAEALDLSPSAVSRIVNE